MRAFKVVFGALCAVLLFALVIALLWSIYRHFQNQHPATYYTSPAGGHVLKDGKVTCVPYSEIMEAERNGGVVVIRVYGEGRNAWAPVHEFFETDKWAGYSNEDRGCDFPVEKPES